MIRIFATFKILAYFLHEIFKLFIALGLTNSKSGFDVKPYLFHIFSSSTLFLVIYFAI